MSYKFNYKSLTISINYNTQLDNYNITLLYGKEKYTCNNKSNSIFHNFFIKPLIVALHSKDGLSEVHPSRIFELIKKFDQSYDELGKYEYVDLRNLAYVAAKIIAPQYKSISLAGKGEALEMISPHPTYLFLNNIIAGYVIPNELLNFLNDFTPIKFNNNIDLYIIETDSNTEGSNIQIIFYNNIDYLQSNIITINSIYHLYYIIFIDIVLLDDLDSNDELEYNRLLLYYKYITKVLSDAKNTEVYNNTADMIDYVRAKIIENKNTDLAIVFNRIVTHHFYSFDNLYKAKYNNSAYIPYDTIEDNN